MYVFACSDCSRHDGRNPCYVVKENFITPDYCYMTKFLAEWKFIGMTNGIYTKNSIVENIQELQNDKDSFDD